MSDYREGQMAVSKDGKQRVVYRGGQWINDDTFVPEVKAKTTAQDVKDLSEASARAEAERDAMRTYADTRRAVTTMDSGPYKAAILEALTPEDGGDWLDKVGGAVGWLPSRLYQNSTREAFDHLRTVNAQTALDGSQQMKGSSSDKDTALMRMAGVGPARTKAENYRILDKAQRDAGLSQALARVKARWITKFGSQSAAAPNGMTMEDALQVATKAYHEDYSRREAARKAGRPLLPPRLDTARRSNLPTPPPRTKKASGPVTFDMDGNIIE
jgi:hypothetical protein